VLHVYHDIAPAPALRPYIQAYRLDVHPPGVAAPEADDARPAARCRILPDGGGCLLIKRFDPVPLAAPRFQLRFVGPRSRSIDVSLRRRSFTLAVLFRPGGARALLDLDVTALADESVPAARARPVLAERLREGLTAAHALPGVLRAVNQALREVCSRAKAPSSTVQAAARSWRASPSASVRDVAATVGVSTRHLRTLFREHVGLAPKRWARVVRLRQLVRRLQASPGGAWTPLALDAGFYDQAHMVRDVQALMGEAPTDLERRVRQSPTPVSLDADATPFRFLQDTTTAAS
jgi:methylphosphotriester-DNA--protein-cysteine methyltransferase